MILILNILLHSAIVTTCLCFTSLLYLSFPSSFTKGLYWERIDSCRHYFFYGNYNLWGHYLTDHSYEATQSRWTWEDWKKYAFPRFLHFWKAIQIHIFTPQTQILPEFYLRIFDVVKFVKVLHSFHTVESQWRLKSKEKCCYWKINCIIIN